MGIGFSFDLVVVDIVHVENVVTVESKYDPPISSDPNAPESSKTSLQLMQSKSGNRQVVR